MKWLSCRLFISTFIVLFSIAQCVRSAISDSRLCADEECKTILSHAKTLARHQNNDPIFLSFGRGEIVKILSKSSGSRPDLWGGQIGDRKGYFPRSFVREYKVDIPNPQKTVFTEGHGPPDTPPHDDGKDETDLDDEDDTEASEDEGYETDSESNKDKPEEKVQTQKEDDGTEISEENPDETEIGEGTEGGEQKIQKDDGQKESDNKQTTEEKKEKPKPEENKEETEVDETEVSDGDDTDIGFETMETKDDTEIAEPQGDEIKKEVDESRPPEAQSDQKPTEDLKNKEGNEPSAEIKQQEIKDTVKAKDEDKNLANEDQSQKDLISSDVKIEGEINGDGVEIVESEDGWVIQDQEDLPSKADENSASVKGQKIADDKEKENQKDVVKPTSDGGDSAKEDSQNVGDSNQEQPPGQKTNDVEESLTSQKTDVKDPQNIQQVDSNVEEKKDNQKGDSNIQEQQNNQQVQGKQVKVQVDAAVQEELKPESIVQDAKKDDVGIQDPQINQKDDSQKDKVDLHDNQINQKNDFQREELKPSPATETPQTTVIQKDVEVLKTETLALKEMDGFTIIDGTPFPLDMFDDVEPQKTAVQDTESSTPIVATTATETTLASQMTASVHAHPDKVPDHVKQPPPGNLQTKEQKVGQTQDGEQSASADEGLRQTSQHPVQIKGQVEQEQISKQQQRDVQGDQPIPQTTQDTPIQNPQQPDPVKEDSQPLKYEKGSTDHFQGQVEDVKVQFVQEMDAEKTQPQQKTDTPVQDVGTQVNQDNQQQQQSGTQQQADVSLNQGQQQLEQPVEIQQQQVNKVLNQDQQLQEQLGSQQANAEPNQQQQVHTPHDQGQQQSPTNTELNQGQPPQQLGSQQANVVPNQQQQAHTPQDQGQQQSPTNTALNQGQPPQQPGSQQANAVPNQQQQMHTPQDQGQQQSLTNTELNQGKPPLQPGNQQANPVSNQQQQQTNTALDQGQQQQQQPSSQHANPVPNQQQQQANTALNQGQPPKQPSSQQANPVPNQQQQHTPLDQGQPQQQQPGSQQANAVPNQQQQHAPLDQGQQQPQTNTALNQGQQQQLGNQQQQDQTLPNQQQQQQSVTQKQQTDVPLVQAERQKQQVKTQGQQSDTQVVHNQQQQQLPGSQGQHGIPQNQIPPQQPDKQEDQVPVSGEVKSDLPPQKEAQKVEIIKPLTEGGKTPHKTPIKPITDSIRRVREHKITEAPKEDIRGTTSVAEQLMSSMNVDIPFISDKQQATQVLQDKTQVKIDVLNATETKLPSNTEPLVHDIYKTADFQTRKMLSHNTGANVASIQTEDVQPDIKPPESSPSQEVVTPRPVQEEIPPPPTQEDVTADPLGEPSDHVITRKINDEKLEEMEDQEYQNQQSWRVGFRAMEGKLKTVVEKLPPSLQSLLEQEPLGLTPQMTVLVTITTFVMLMVITCITCLFGGKKKMKKTDPVVVVRGLEEKLFIATKERENLEDELEIKHKKVKELEQEVQLQTSSSGDIASEVDKYKTLVQEYKGTASSQQSEIEKFNTELSQKKKDLQSKTNKFEESQKQLKKKEQALEAVSEKLKSANKEIDSFKSELKSEKTQNASLTRQKEQLETSKQQLLQEAEDWNEKLQDLTERFETAQKGQTQIQEDLAFKENELEVLRDCFLQLKSFENEDSEDQDETDGKSIQDKLKAMMDVSDVNARLKTIEDERNLTQNRMEIEVQSRMDMEEKVAELESKVEAMKTDKMKAERQSHDSTTKLNVLTNYFKEKEAQLQKELGEQEALKKQNINQLENAGEVAKMVTEELASYKSQTDDLKKEILSAERDFRSQIAANEKKAHDNWLSARAAERELKESRHECSVLRQKLTDLERRLMQGPSGLIRPLPTRGMPPPGMMNGPPLPPGIDRPGSRSGPFPPPPPPGMRDEDMRGSPGPVRLPPHDRRGPRMPPPDVRSPPPFGRGPPPPMDRRSPPPYDRLRGPPGYRIPPPPDMLPPHLRGPPPPHGPSSPPPREPPGSRHGAGTPRHRAQDHEPDHTPRQSSQV